MNNIGHVIRYKKKKFFGLVTTIALGIRHSGDYFVIFEEENSAPKKVHMNDIGEIKDSMIIKSTIFKVLQGERFLERSIFNNRTCNREVFLRQYMNVVKDKAWQTNIKT